MVTMPLAGSRGTIAHVIDQTGVAATAGATVQKLMTGP